MDFDYHLLSWIVFGLILLIAEMFTGTFYLLFVGLAAFLTAVFVLMITAPVWAELIVFAVLTISAVMLVQKKIKTQSKKELSMDQNRTLVLSETLQPGEEKSISYQGSLWTAINQSQQEMKTGDRVRISKMDGIKIILKKEHEV